MGGVCFFRWVLATESNFFVFLFFSVAAIQTVRCAGRIGSGSAFETLSGLVSRYTLSVEVRSTEHLQV